MIQINDTFITELLSNPELKKSDTRTVIFLLQRPGALSSDELAAGVGVSKRAINKSVNRLIRAGLIQPGEFQAKRRALNIPEMVQMEPKTVAGGSVEESLKTLTGKVDHLQTLIGSLTGALEAVTSHDVQNMTGIMPVCVQVEEQKNTQAGMMLESGQKETGLNPARIPDDQNMTQPTIQATMDHNGIPDGIEQDTNMTGTVTIQAIEETAENTQSEMMPVSDSERTKAVSVILGKGTKGTTDDTFVSDLDTALIRARGLLEAKQQLLLSNKEKAKSSLSDTCTPASVGDEFHALFGVHLPAGSDQAAAAVMIARKKAGKLDNVKSPMGYLNSLAGKVTPTLATPAQLQPAQMINSQLVTEPPRLSHADMSRLNDMWEAMTGEQRIPFEETALPKFESQTGKHKVPLHLLAKGVFNAQQMSQRG